MDLDETFDGGQGVDVQVGTWDAGDEGAGESGRDDGTLE